MKLKNYNYLSDSEFKKTLKQKGIYRSLEEKIIELREIFIDSENKFKEGYVIEGLEYIQDGVILDNEIFFKRLNIEKSNINKANNLFWLVIKQGYEVYKVNNDNIRIGFGGDSNFYDFNRRIIVLEQKPRAASIFEETHHSLQHSKIKQFNNEVNNYIEYVVYILRGLIFPEDQKYKDYLISNNIFDKIKNKPSLKEILNI